jgi:Zn-dependent M28 family amino/carboxypeptidase
MKAAKLKNKTTKLNKNTMRQTHYRRTFLLFYLFNILYFIFMNGCSRYRVKQAAVAVDERQLYRHVEYLTGTQSFRNYLNIERLNLIAGYIKQHFDSLNYKIREQKFLVRGSEYTNIIGTYNNQKDKKVIIGAHYDVCSDQPGADDNASGIAGLLEIARIIKQMEDSIPYNIELVAYTLEEPPFFGTEFMGSYIHAHSLKENNETIAGMICLEMIGYFSEEEGSQHYPIGIMKLFYPTKGNFISAIANPASRRLASNYKTVLEKTTSLKCITYNGPSWFAGVDYSDHRNYWQLGYKAMMLTDTSFMRNKYYHTTGDTIDTLDFQKMAAVVQGVVNLLISSGI